MLPSTCSREALLAYHPCPPWNLPSFTAESTLSSLCSRSDTPIFRQSAAPAHLDSLLPHDLVLRTDGSVPPPLGKGGSGSRPPTALSVLLRPLFPFRHAQYAQVFPLKPVPFCTLFAGLGSTSKPATSLLFSYYLTLALSSPLSPLLRFSFYLKLCGRSGRTCLLSPVPSGYIGSPDTRFSPGTTQLMDWPDGERYLRPLQSLVISLLLFLVCTLLFSRTGGELSHRNSSTSRFPRFPPRTLCSHRHARCVLSRLCCNGHSLLLSPYLPRIGRIENPSCSACQHSSQNTSHLILRCPATDSLRRSLFGDSLSLYDLWSRPWRVARLLGLHGLSPCRLPWEGVG